MKKYNFEIQKQNLVNGEVMTIQTFDHFYGSEKDADKVIAKLNETAEENVNYTWMRLLDEDEFAA